jgi:divalent metal cation (Fe/Co/Zn/Cd) transporter
MATSSAQAAYRRAFLLEYATLVWCALEASVSIWLGIVASSIALIGFGLDSVIEMFAAFVVLWQLRGSAQPRTKRAMRLIGITFFLLAAYVLAESVRALVMRVEPKPSLVGIGFTAVALVVMSLLFRMCRCGSTKTGFQRQREGHLLFKADSSCV